MALAFKSDNDLTPLLYYNDTVDTLPLLDLQGGRYRDTKRDTKVSVPVQKFKVPKANCYTNYTASTIGIDTGDTTGTTTLLKYNGVVQKYLYQPATAENTYQMAAELGTAASNIAFDTETNTLNINYTPLDNVTTGANYITNYTNNNLFYNNDTTLINNWFPLDGGYGFDGANAPMMSRRSQLRAQLSPAVHVRSAAVQAESPQEAIAQETLREVVTEDQYRKYLRYGFVLVQGLSGATYQVFRNRTHVKVWVGGKLVEEVCVYLKAVEGLRVPPTDKVVAFKTMIEADEEAFKGMGNRYRMAVAA